MVGLLRGGRDKGRTTKKKKLFLKIEKKRKNVITKLEGWGGVGRRALVVGPLKRTFFAASRNELALLSLGINFITDRKVYNIKYFYDPC